MKRSITFSASTVSFDVMRVVFSDGCGFIVGKNSQKLTMSALKIVFFLIATFHSLAFLLFGKKILYEHSAVKLHLYLRSILSMNSTLCLSW